MSLFPGALPVFAGFTSSHTLAADSHAAQHNLEQAEVVNIATKVGTGSSTSSNNTVLRGNGAGTSVWAQVGLTTDVTGVLPIANGGLGQASLTALTLPSAILSNPTISGTVTGGATYTSPILTTPIIADFTNANHNHQNVAGGGTIGASAITGVNSNVLSNPYKFSVYRNTALTSLNTPTLVPFDTKNFDTGSNIDVVTNKGRFTAPITGFYFFVGHAGNDSLISGVNDIYLYKNGTLLREGIAAITSGTQLVTSTVEGLFQLSANDYIEIYYKGGNGTNITVGKEYCYFEGYLISAT